MPQYDDKRPQGTGELRPDEIAAEGAAELPDREAMSLITGPGGAGPLPFIGHPVGPMPPGDTYEIPRPYPLPVAQDTGTTA